MKKQIFKLTSILLAMVMVFTMFSIMPISAEEQSVDLATAVANLKTAWFALDAAEENVVKTSSVIYLKTPDGTYDAGVWEAPAGYAADSAPSDATSVDNYTFPVYAGQTTTAIYANNNNTALTICDYTMAQYEDVYFYYKTDDAGLKLKPQIVPNKNTGANEDIMIYGNHPDSSLPATEGQWVKKSFIDWFNETATQYDWQAIVDSRADYPYNSRFTFNFTSDSAAEGTPTSVSLGNLYITVDANLIGTNDLTDYEWYDKVAAVDPVALKAQYNDDENSATWQAFVAAREAVLSCSAEANTQKAVAQLKEAWVNLAHTEKHAIAGHYIRFWNNSITNANPSKTADATYGFVSPISGIQNTDSEFGGVTGSTRANLVLYESGTTLVGDFDDIGFWYKGTSAIRALIYTGFNGGTPQGTYASGTTVLPGGNTWTFISIRELIGETNWSTLMKDLKGYAMTRIYVDLGDIVDSSVSSIDATFGGTFYIDSTADIQALEGSAAVVAAAAVDLAAFTDGAEKTAFEEALSNALVYYPEVGGPIAVEKLRAAAAQMISSANSADLYPGGYYVTGRNDFGANITTIASTSAEYVTYGYAISPEYTLTAQASRSLQGIWMSGTAGSAQSAATSAIHLDSATEDSYFTVKVVDVADDSAAASLNIGLRYQLTTASSASNPSSYMATVNNVVDGGEYKFYINDIVKAAGFTLNDFKSTTAGGTGHKIHIISIEAGGSNITAQAGSLVTATYYEPSDAVGEEFVAEMAALDISAYYNTAAFEAALAEAVSYYPEVSASIAVEKLRNAASQMVTSFVTYDMPAKVPTAANAATYSTLNETDDYKYGGYYVNASGANIMPAQSAVNQITGSVWFNNPATTDRTAKYLGAYDENTFVTVNVTSAEAGAKLRFWFRPTGTDLNESDDFYFNYELPVTAGKEYRIYLKDLFAAGGASKTASETDRLLNYKENCVTTADTSVKYAATIFCMFAYGGAIEATVGSFMAAEFYTPSAKTGAAFVSEMASLDVSSFKNTEAFNAALTEAISYYPEVGEVIEIANAAKELKNIWKGLTYIPQQIKTAPVRAYGQGGSDATRIVWADGDETSQGYLTSASGVGTAYLFPVDEYKDTNDAATPYEWFVWGNVGDNIFLKEDMQYFGIWYKSDVQVTNIRVIAQASTYLNNSDGVLPATGDEWKFITCEEIMGTTKWETFLNNGALTDISDFRFMTTSSTARSTEIYFGDLVVYGKDKQINGIDSWTNMELARKSANVDFSVYDIAPETQATFIELSERLNAFYAKNLLAEDVINSVDDLNKQMYLRPVTTTTKYIEDSADSEIKTYLYGTSDNGDFTATINTVDFGGASTSPYSGGIRYETSAPLTLAQIDDIYFSYKIENKIGPATAARIFFYAEDFYKEDYETDADTGEYVLDEEGNKIVTSTYDEWHCGMEAYGTTRYLSVDDSNQGVWVETSLATIFGDDWKEVYLGYLNKNTVGITYTAENTTISKLALGFNGGNVEGDYADVTVGSMFVDRADNALTITASATEPAEVLDQALNLDLTGVKKSVADNFKRLVKELAELTNTEIISGKFYAGNYGAGEPSLADLSVLSRYVDAVEAGTEAEFLENNFIALDDGATVSETDVADLRAYLLGLN